MKFEEILPELRNGKKVKNTEYGEDGEYWIAGYIKFRNIYDDDGKLLEYEKNLTIHRNNKNNEAIFDKYSWGIPRWLIMSDKWEVIE